MNSSRASCFGVVGGQLTAPLGPQSCFVTPPKRVQLLPERGAHCGPGRFLGTLGAAKVVEQRDRYPFGGGMSRPTVFPCWRTKLARAMRSRNASVPPSLV